MKSILLSHTIPLSSLFAAAGSEVNLLDYISRASIVTFLILVVYGGYKKWWVFGWVYRESEERCEKIVVEKDAWRHSALTGANIATQAFEEVKSRQSGGI